VQPREQGQKLFLVDQAAAALLKPVLDGDADASQKPEGTTRSRPGRSV
jgi:hypothetical protein